MKTLEKIVSDLIGKGIDEIVETFEDYTFEGENSIIVSKDESTEYDYQAYADHKNAPIIGIKLNGDEIIEADIL